MKGQPLTEDKPPWWTYPGGWEREGVHTPMRRCGVCKCDLSELERQRGLCRQHATESDDRQRRERIAHERAQREDQENAALRPQPHTEVAVDAGFTAEPDDDIDEDEDDFDRAQRAIREGMR